MEWSRQLLIRVQAIHQFKYGFVSNLSGFLTEVIWHGYTDTVPPFDFLLPVPLHHKRMKERGFNQSYLLSKNLAKKLNIPIYTDLLVRTRFTIPQADLTGDVRKKDLHKAFDLGGKADLTGLSIGILDDVVTTRSTFFECARVLKRNGALVVWGIVVAHGN